MNFADMPGLAAPLLPRDDLTLAQYDQSDRGNSQRFVARYGDQFLFVRGQGWFAYTGQYWSREGAQAMILRAAAATAAAIEQEVIALYAAAKQKLEDPRAAAGEVERMRDRASALQDWMTTSGGVSRLKGMLTIAEASLTAELSDFDADPYAINCQNGTLRFVKDESAPRGQQWRVKLDKHDPADKISRIAAFNYTPGAPAPVWDAHLARCVPDISERMFLMRTLGYCCLGLTAEQCFFIWQGRGGDGKSVTTGAVRRVLGSYAAKVDVKTFLEDRNARSAGAPSPDIARLAGATRFVTASEPPKGARLNEALVKEFTGGAPLLARHLNKDPFEFLPLFKLIIDCNPLPAIGGADDGIWRRIVLHPWREQLKREEMDPQIEDKIVREGDGLLAQLVDGALKYLERGLTPPDTIRTAQADYKSGSNPFRDWLDEFTIADPEHTCRQSRLYESYKEEQERQGFGDKMMSAKGFGMALSDHQVLRLREGGTGHILRRGLRLMTETERTARARPAAPPPLATDIVHDGSQSEREAAPADPFDAESWRYEGD